MNPARRRKMTYVIGIVVLFTLLIPLGGWLDRTAAANRLAQRSLGKINPVSGVANLVLVGFRGVAVTFLWQEAIELKRQERWFEIRPVLESITLLQPHFVEPWTFQAWNMAYNIAAEWEAVADKYYWMREGIDFMKNAVAQNNDVSDMEWYVGWLYYNRFGMSDEKMYLRDLFRKLQSSRRKEDIEFARANNGRFDNFEVAYDWFVTANNTVKRLNEKPKKRGIGPFMSYPAISKSQYANFLQEEGTFGLTAKNAWRDANNEWLQFGRFGEPSPNRDTDLFYRIEFSPEEWSRLTEEQRYWADHYAKIVNYNYWKLRTAREATDEMQTAKELFYKARMAAKVGDYREAIAAFEKAFPIWRKILEEDSNLRNDDLFREDSQEYEYRYLRLLSKLDMPAPQRRPFEGIYEPMDTPLDTVLQQSDLRRVEETPASGQPGK